MTTIDYDIVIAGGGIVGCAAALALSTTTDYSIAVIEAFEPESMPSDIQTTLDQHANEPQHHPSFDAKVVALANESFQHLQEFGLTISGARNFSNNLASAGGSNAAADILSALNCCPIKHIHVSDRGHLGQVQLLRQNASEQDDKPEQNLGYVVPLAELGQHMLKQLQNTQVTYLCPEQITAVERHTEYTQLKLSSTQINTKLVLIAEGGLSPSRKLFNFTNTVDDYEQTAIIANVITQLPHENRAFERFTSQGPIALLPMQSENGDQMSLVWTANRQKAEQILAFDDSEFLCELQRLFGDKLGRFEASSARFSYPLFLNRVDDFAGHRVICLGNAAQSLHPIAGQGFNLGVRDIQGLIAVLNNTAKQADKHDPGAFAITQAYKKERKKDKASVISATDTLVKIFSNQYLPFTLTRNLGLIALNHHPRLKNTLASFAMGER